MYYSSFMFSKGNYAKMGVSTASINQTVSVGLSAINPEITFIDWGDGSGLTPINYVVSGGYQIYPHTYANIGNYCATIISHWNIKSFYKVDLEGITSLDLTGMPLTCIYLSATGSAVFLDITGLSLAFIFLASASGITGSITGMPLTFLSCDNSGITGSIDNMALTFLVSIGSTLTGTLSTSSRLTRLFIINTTSIAIPTSALAFGAGVQNIYINQIVGRTSAEIDAMLIAAAAAIWWSGAKTISAVGNNAAHTAASESAIKTLQGLGITVTVN